MSSYRKSTGPTKSGVLAFLASVFLIGLYIENPRHAVALVAISAGLMILTSNGKDDKKRRQEWARRRYGR